MDKSISSEKCYRVTFEQRPEYLYARITADKETLEISTAIWTEIAGKCKQKNCEKLLVEQDISKIEVSHFEKYECVNNFVSAFMRIDIAFVDSRVEQMELNEFMELVATNRGLCFR